MPHPLVEAFLIIEQPRQRLGHWLTTLAPLDNGEAPPLASITACWDPTTDHALLGLSYDELALGDEHLRYVVEIALLAEIGMIQPAELAEGERRRYLAERLARCTVRVSDQRNVATALTELARRIREQKSTTRAAIASIEPRGTTQEPVLLVKPKGTRDLTRDDAAIPPAARDEVLRHASPNTVSRYQRAATVEVPPGELERMRSTSARVTPSAPFAAAAPPIVSRAGTQRTERYLPSATGPLPPGIIYARYLRGGRWLPIRIGALSLRGAALMAGALPRLHDNVDVALTFGDHRALVRGPVSKISSQTEAQLSGAASFSVAFELDEASRRQLTNLLTAARAAKVVIKPPPARENRRYPVEWPISLSGARGAMRANAMDVSRAGMFLKPHNPLTLDSELVFSAVLDDGGPPVSGRATVVRHVTEAEARSVGLIAGWGVRIVEMGDDDRARWGAFLERVEKRSEKRILIGASPTRLAELQMGLSAAGYVVTGGTDVGALVQLASTESRPVDAAMIDGGWLTPGMPVQWVESLFSARNVPCVTVHGADARRARTTVDKLLAVV